MFRCASYRLIGSLMFYAVSTVFQPHNDGCTIKLQTLHIDNNYHFLSKYMCVNCIVYLADHENFSDRKLSIVIVFFRSTGQILNRLGTKHPLVERNHACSRATPFPREDDTEIAKILQQNFEIFFSRTTEPISTKFEF